MHATWIKRILCAKNKSSLNGIIIRKTYFPYRIECEWVGESRVIVWKIKYYLFSLLVKHYFWAHTLLPLLCELGGIFALFMYDFFFSFYLISHLNCWHTLIIIIHSILHKLKERGAEEDERAWSIYLMIEYVFIRYYHVRMGNVLFCWFQHIFHSCMIFLSFSKSFCESIKNYFKIFLSIAP